MPADREIASIMSHVRHLFLKDVAALVLANPEGFAVKFGYMRELAECLDPDTMREVASLPRGKAAQLLLEAAEVAAECHTGSLGIYVVFAMFGFCDCLARQLMRNGVALDDAASARLIGFYERRLLSDGFAPAFACKRDDAQHRNEGAHVFALTVAPKVRHRKLLGGETASAVAFRRLLAAAEASGLPPEELRQLKAVTWGRGEIPPPSCHVQPPRPEDVLRAKVGRPSHIPEDAWERALKSYASGSRQSVREASMSAERQAMWLIQDALEPEIEGPPLSDAEVVARIEAQSVPAIWLHRLRPMHDRDAATSYFGGLPRLAPDLAWPRTRKEGLALPLVAQIDCSQIPAVSGGENLPRTGTLYFFVHPHTEFEPEECRGHVLYSPRAASELPVSAPPANPRLCHEDGYILSGYDEWIDPETMPDLMPVRYEQWAIEPLTVETFARNATWQIQQALYRGHDSRKSGVVSHRLEQLFRGVVCNAQMRASGKHIAEDRPRLDQPIATAENGYPWCWLFVLAHAGHWLQAGRNHAAATSDPMQASRYPEHQRDAIGGAMARLAKEAASWVEIARTHAPDEPVSRKDKEAFTAWLAHVAESMTFAHDWNERFAYQLPAARGVDSAARQLIATSPRARDLLPPYFFEVSRYWAERSPYGLHQMLGHASNEQSQADRLGKDHALLLQLASDGGMNWMWGDCNTLQFWIRLQDLAARRFDKVVVTFAGG